MQTTDQNGDPVNKDVRREPDGTWTAQVWIGYPVAHDIRRYQYRTRAAARNASITDMMPDNDQPADYIGVFTSIG